MRASRISAGFCQQEVSSQIHVSCRNGRVDQALSWGFLLGWVAGDLTNFRGCYLTNQLPIQIVTAVFYVNRDLIMISQFVYYKLKHQKVTKCSHNLRNFCISWVVVCGALGVTALCQLVLRNQEQSTAIPRNNFQGRSTEGTSYLLFALAMMGNCTCGLSLVLKMPKTKSSRGLYFVHHLPWLIGSFGVLFLGIFYVLYVFAAAFLWCALKINFILAPRLPPLCSLPWDLGASLHMTLIPGFSLDWGLNPILLIVLQFKLYGKQMLPNQVTLQFLLSRRLRGRWKWNRWW